MFTVEYRFKETNGRFTKWYTVSEHEHLKEAREHLAQQIADFWSFNARLVDQRSGKVLADYKYIEEYQ